MYFFQVYRKFAKNPAHPTLSVKGGRVIFCMMSRR